MPLPQVPLRHTCLRFDAGAAQAWTALDVLPNEARGWRAGGHDPATAAPVLAGTPPDATRIPPGDYHWSMVGGPHVTPGEPLDFNDPQVRAAMHYPAGNPRLLRRGPAAIRTPSVVRSGCGKLR